MTVRVSVMHMRMVESHDTDQVHGEPEGAHDYQFDEPAHLSRCLQPLDRLPDDLDRDQHEEDSVREAGERVHFAEPVRVALRRWPLGHDCCAEPDEERKAVEEHVYAIRDETETAGGEAIGGLNEHENKVEAVPSDVNDRHLEKGRKGRTT